MGNAFKDAQKAQKESGISASFRDSGGVKHYNQPHTSLDGKAIEPYVISQSDPGGNVVQSREALTEEEVTGLTRMLESSGRSYSIAKVDWPPDTQTVATTSAARVSESLQNGNPVPISGTGAVAPQLFEQTAIVPSDPNSDLILSLRGTFFWVRLSDISSPGIYAIDELNRFMEKYASRDYFGPENPILLTNIDIIQSDITSEVPCLNNVKVFYTFGQNFGQVQISGEMLLGPMGSDDQHQRGFRLLRDFFYDHRVSNFRRPISVSVCKEPLYVFLKGLRVGQVEPNFHIMPFVMFGTLLDIKREDALALNPETKTITMATVGQSSLEAALRASKPDDFVVVQEATGKTDLKKSAAATDTKHDKPLATEKTLPNMVVKEAFIEGQGLTADERLYYDVRQANLANQIDHNGRVTQINQIYKDNDAKRKKALEEETIRYGYVKSNLDKIEKQVGDRVVAKYKDKSPKTDQDLEKDAEARQALLDENKEFLGKLQINTDDPLYTGGPSKEYTPYRQQTFENNSLLSSLKWKPSEFKSPPAPPESTPLNINRNAPPPFFFISK